MQEAVKATIDSITESLDIQRIDAHIYYDNEKSIALAKRLGFSFYGETEIYVFREKEYLHHIYTLYL